MQIHQAEKPANSSKTSSNQSPRQSQQSSRVCLQCLNSKEDLLAQIAQLKDKAHQSFMQVLQIQELHQEELAQLRAQSEEREVNSLAEAEELRFEVERLKREMNALQRNARRHSFDTDREINFQNIDIISCLQEQTSHLDESQFLQFKDIVMMKTGLDYVNCIRKQVAKDAKFANHNKAQLQKLFYLIKEIKDENFKLVKINEELKRKIKAEEEKNRVERANQQKETKFMSEQLKRIGNQKLKMEKKLSELEKLANADSFPKRMASTGTESLPQGIKTLSSSPSSREDDSAWVKAAASPSNQTRKMVTQLNYAKFMLPEESQGTQTPSDLRKQKSVQLFKHVSAPGRA